MAIPAKALVQVTPRVLSGSGTDLVMNGLVLSTNTLLPVGTVKEMADTSEVGDFFGYDSAEYDAASAYFNGYDNSTMKPSNYLFYRHPADAIAPFIRSAEISSPATVLNQLKAVSSGSISVTIAGTTMTATEIDLSQVSSLSEAASAVQTAINNLSTDPEFLNAILTYSSNLSSFIFTAGTAGAEISMGYCSGTIAEIMGLDESAQDLSAGADEQTYTETLDDIIDSTQNFVTIITADELTDGDDVTAIADWVNNQYNEGSQYLYVYHTTDENLLTEDALSDEIDTTEAKVDEAIVDSTTLGGNSGIIGINLLYNNNYTGVTAVYGSVEYAAFVQGTAASIDWESSNSAITFAFKAQDGLSALVTKQSYATQLQANKVNFVGEYASRNDDFIFFQNGQMFGDWAWIDTYINSTWLNNALQVQILSLFETAGRIPYTERGYAQIRAACTDVFEQAINNGVIEAGVNLSQTQINELTIEVGKDISTELYSNGYYLQINDADADTRQARETPDCGLWYTYGGSVHAIQIPSTAVV